MIRKSQHGRKAGLVSDWYQMNQGQTKDCLGMNGLVRKGLMVADPTKAKAESPYQTMSSLNKTASSSIYSKTWCHNDMEKGYRYYGFSEFDKDVYN